MPIFTVENLCPMRAPLEAMGLAKIEKFIAKLLRVEILYEGYSQHGSLKVYKEQGAINLVSGGTFVQSSYRPQKKPLGSVWDYFLVAPLFAPNPEKVKNICILGLGAGAAVKLLNQVYRIERIVGVEIDEDIVNLGRRFFDLNDKNLEVLIKEAQRYVKETSEKFNIILVDAFADNKVAPGCNTSEFFHSIVKILTEEGVVLVNRVSSQEQREVNKEFLGFFLKLFPQVYALKVRKNIFYIGLKKPLERFLIEARIKKASEKNDFLVFLRKFNRGNLQLLSESYFPSFTP